MLGAQSTTKGYIRAMGRRKKTKLQDRKSNRIRSKTKGEDRSRRNQMIALKLQTGADSQPGPGKTLGKKGQEVWHSQTC